MPLCSFHLLLSGFTILKVLFKADFGSSNLCFHEYCPPSGILINGYYDVWKKNAHLSWVRDNILKYFDQNHHIGRWCRVGESVYFFRGKWGLGFTLTLFMGGVTAHSTPPSGGCGRVGPPQPNSFFDNKQQNSESTNLILNHTPISSVLNKTPQVSYHL